MNSSNGTIRTKFEDHYSTQVYINEFYSVNLINLFLKCKRIVSLKYYNYKYNLILIIFNTIIVNKLFLKHT